MIAILNMLFESLLVPRVARALAKFRLGATVHDELETATAIKLSVLRVNTTFVLLLYMIVIALMICVFALDEVTQIIHTRVITSVASGMHAVLSGIQRGPQELARILAPCAGRASGDPARLLQQANRHGFLLRVAFTAIDIDVRGAFSENLDVSSDACCLFPKATGRSD